MIFVFTVIAAILGFIPGASFILIPMEMYIVYKFANESGRFNLFEFCAFGAALWAVSAILIGFAQILHFIPLIGQVANSIVAGSVMYFVGHAAEKHYA
ncbi:hypothetical protein NDN01_05020 [Sphingomonas sp. QA11]|uniref:hypothetical protein n=1 Tax=Sphingomonas sp. QA11 TaxID=2950605 RepID=UPI0023490A68|nr:hypothetical protein [Sphingomonas sp. QA11]WCM28287.1 hypothetical protein NDN01_05020 [Sphingomonas sp. QA11]